MSSRADIFSIEPYRLQTTTVDAVNVTFTPLVPGDWFPPPTDVSDALDQLAKRKTYLLTLGSLDPSGTWYPLNFVGPTGASSSSSILYGYGGVGFCQVPQDGIVKNFKLTQAYTTFTTLDVQLWHAPASNPVLFAFTGITMTIVAGDYVASNSIDTFSVSEGDLLVFFNGDPSIGYTPSAMTIVCEFVTT